MPVEAKTIQIFLPDGQPRGIRIADITTRIVQAIAVPRTQLEFALSRGEASRIALYFLFGQTDEQARPMVYVGQTEDLPARMRAHNANKDFWQTAVWVLSKTESFTQAHIKYLEWFSIGKTREAGRYALDNGNEGTEPFVTEPMKADIMDAFETATTLLGTLGYPVFEPVVSRAPESPAVDVYICTGSGADARGALVEDGFVVLKDSIARAGLVPSARDGYLELKRDALLKSGVLVPDGDHLRFTQDYLFDTPSGAAMVVMGRTANGWYEWRKSAPDGRSLHELKRAPTTQAAPSATT